MSSSPLRGNNLCAVRTHLHLCTSTYLLESGVTMSSRPLRGNNSCAVRTHLHLCILDGMYSSSRENTTQWKYAAGSDVTGLVTSASDNWADDVTDRARKSHWYTV